MNTQEVVTQVNSSIPAMEPFEHVMDNQSELFLDTSDDSFFSLDDLVLETKGESRGEMEVKEEEVSSEGGEEDLFSYEEEEENNAEEGILEEKEAAYNEGLNSFAESFDSIPEDTVFVVGGQQVDKAFIDEAIQKVEDYNTYNDTFSKMETFLKESYNQMVSSAHGLVSETAERINAYEQAKLQTNDPQLLGSYDLELRDLHYLQQANEQKTAAMRQSMLQTQEGLIRTKMERIQQQMIGERGHKWHQQSQSINSYALNNGFTQAELQTNLTPHLIKVIEKAMIADSMSAKNGEVLDQIKNGPTGYTSNSPVSTKSSSKGKQQNKASKRQQVEAAYTKGLLSDVDVFNSLSD